MNRELSIEEEIIFEQLMRKTEQEKIYYLLPLLEKYYDRDIIKVTKDYIAVMYDGPICLVAHLDCVKENKVGYKFVYDRTRGLATSISGLGFDDVAGIAMILKLLARGYRMPLLFPCGEEVGMTGACKFIQDYPEVPWPSVKFFLELDRRGSRDLVTYEYNNPLFDKYIEDFGYFTKAFGSCSDISILGPHYHLASCNLSVGYYDEHTQNEWLNVSEWLMICDEVALILDDRDYCPSFEYIEDVSPYTNVYGFPTDDDDHWYSMYQYSCDECGVDGNSAELEWAYDEKGNFIWLCKRCLAQLCDVCAECDNYYIVGPDGPQEHQCENCKKYKKVTFGA